MNFSWARTVRRNLWVFTPGELSITLLLSVFFLLALGAFLSGRPGAGLALSAAFLYVLIWLGWMLYAALRQMPPFGRFGHLQRIMPLAGLALCFSLSGLLILRLHLSLSEALFYGQSQDSVDRGVSFWTGTLQGHAFLAGLFCLFFLGFFAWLLGLWAFHYFWRRALYQRFILGLILVFAGGFLGALLFPSFAPQYFHPQEWQWLESIGGYPAIRVFMAQPNSPAGAFPGLYGALAAFLLFWQMSHDRRSLVWCFPLALFIWLSTLLLGFHYFSDLVSGGLLAAAAVWLAPRLERLAGLWRRTQQPPFLWLSNLTESYGDEYGKLAGRMGALQDLGAVTSPGFVAGGVSRNRAEEPMRRALQDMGGEPFWVRPSDVSGSQRETLSALKPLSLEKVIRLVFNGPSQRHNIVQKALKVSAMGVCRAFPPRDFRLSDVEIRMTTLAGGEVLISRLAADKTVLMGCLDAPWSYFPPSFPLRGFELFEVSRLARRLAARLGRFAEVEWVLSDGKVFVLDGRPVRGEPSATNEP